MCILNEPFLILFDHVLCNFCLDVCVYIQGNVYKKKINSKDIGLMQLVQFPIPFNVMKKKCYYCL